MKFNSSNTVTSHFNTVLVLYILSISHLKKKEEMSVLLLYYQGTVKEPPTKKNNTRTLGEARQHLMHHLIKVWTRLIFISYEKIIYQ